MRDVITYPLLQELFAITKSDVEARFDRQNFGVDFESKQIWKRCCKNNVDHYNAIPSLSGDCQLQVLISGLLLIVWRLTKLSFFSQLPGNLQRHELRVVWGVTRAAVAQGNLGVAPLGPSPKQ